MLTSFLYLEVPIVDKKQEIISYFKEHPKSSLPAIGAQFNVTWEYVRSVLLEAGLWKRKYVRKDKTKLSKKFKNKRAEIVEDFVVKGLNTIEIGEVRGITRQRVSQILREAGVEVKGKRRRPAA
jgi:DNA-directed RNA polymerase sigma subunit (sigma70/sigma32)